MTLRTFLMCNGLVLYSSGLCVHVFVCGPAHREQW